MGATTGGHYDIVKLLLESGAQKDLQSKVTRREGRVWGAMRWGDRLSVGVRVQVGNGVDN